MTGVNMAIGTDEHTFGLQGPPFDEDECMTEPQSQRDERADAQDWWDNLMEEWRISNR